MKHYFARVTVGYMDTEEMDLVENTQTICFDPKKCFPLNYITEVTSELFHEIQEDAEEK